MCSHGIYTPQCMLMRIIREHKWQLVSYWKNGSEKTAKIATLEVRIFSLKPMRTKWNTFWICLSARVMQAMTFLWNHLLNSCLNKYDFIFIAHCSKLILQLGKTAKEQRTNWQRFFFVCVVLKCVFRIHFGAMHSIGWHVFNRKPNLDKKNYTKKNLTINVKTLIKFNDQSTFQR